MALVKIDEDKLQRILVNKLQLVRNETLDETVEILKRMIESYFPRTHFNEYTKHAFELAISRISALKKDSPEAGNK